MQHQHIYLAVRRPGITRTEGYTLAEYLRLTDLDLAYSRAYVIDRRGYLKLRRSGWAPGVAS